MNNETKKTIYLAGGCFWGTEQYMQNINGVLETEVGYANGNTENPTYEEVCYHNTGHAETVKVIYDETVIPLSTILDYYYDVINPVSVNKQGGDVGTQYRTGIYYIDEQDQPIIQTSIASLQKQYKETIAIEVMPLLNYGRAEEYHQKYLDKNPSGYCHISREKMEQVRQSNNKATDQYVRKSEEELRNTLSQLQYDVTQKSSTEPPFQNEYFNEFRKGIYVDITSGQPLFGSTDKFESGCGWPSFSKPLDDSLVKEIDDLSHGMVRTEVKSMNSNAHLGHVFEDGPLERGGLRYCINSASLRFIPMEEMEKEGYGKWIPFIN